MRHRRSLAPSELGRELGPEALPVLTDADRIYDVEERKAMLLKLLTVLLFSPPFLVNSVCICLFVFRKKSLSLSLVASCCFLRLDSLGPPDL